MVLLSAGMAIVAAPATSGIMNAVPMAKAGVGSAVNDTTRELGGALGIAVFGSIVNSAYRANIDLGGLGLSPSEVAEAEESIGGAAATAATAAGDVGPNLVERAATAFTDAFNLASIISAVIVVASAAIVARHVHPRQGGQRGAARSTVTQEQAAEFELVTAAAATD